MAQKGGKFDASGQPIGSWRIVTDTDADTGIGSLQDPLRVDPTGTTVQPVSITGSVSTTGGLTDTQLRASAVPVNAKIVDSAGSNQATVSAAGAVKVDGSTVTQPVNQTQVNGAAVDVSSGNRSTGTQRVILATDQVQFSGKVLLSEGPASAGVVAGASVLIAAVANSAAPAPTNGQQVPFQTDLAGNQRVNPTGSAGSFKFSVVSATGTNCIATVPAGKKWRVKSISLVFTTSAVAGNRQAQIQTDDTVNVYAAAVDPQTTAASLTHRTTFAPGVSNGAFVNGIDAVGFPEQCLPAAARIVTSLFGVMAADTLTMTVNYIEYLD